MQQKIVLTGGPCAGKTTVSEILVKTFSPRLVLVPEAASMLFQGGFPRLAEGEGKRAQQRAIYYVQRELEFLAQLDHPETGLICDRGSLDGLAYWPGAEAEFFAELNSNLQSEIARYDWVIHLDTTGTKEYRRNSVRVEDFATATAVNERVKAVWKAHPRRVIIPHNDDFSRKIIQSLSVMEAILKGASPDVVNQLTR